MDLSSMIIALPVFFLAYTAAGMIADARKPARRARGTLRQSLGDQLRLADKIGFNRFLLQNDRFRERLDLLLLRSGHPFAWRPEDLLMFKEIGMVAAGFFLWYLDIRSWIVWPLGLIGGFMAADFYLKGKISARKASIQRTLPGVVDLVALTVESGLDLMAALERILEKMKPGALRDELRLLIQETRLGTPRKEALQRLAFRTDLSDVQSLSSMIIQSEELGTSLATVMRNYAEDMRNRRLMRAEEIAGKAPVKLLFPMMVFFFPIVFVIILGPVAMSMMGTF